MGGKRGNSKLLIVLKICRVHYVVLMEYLFSLKKKKRTSKQDLRPKGFSLCGFTHACEKPRREFGPVHLGY